MAPMKHSAEVVGSGFVFTWLELVEVLGSSWLGLSSLGWGWLAPKLRLALGFCSLGRSWLTLAGSRQR